MSARRALAAAALVACAGCSQVLGLDDPKNDAATAATGDGGGGHGGGVTGLVNGAPVTMIESTAVVGTYQGANIVAVMLSTRTGECERGLALTAGASETLALVVLGAAGNVDPGTYDVMATGAAEARVQSDDATCNASPAVSATGTITIAAIDATSVSGHVDLAFTAGALSGDFVAPLCTGLTPAALEQPRTTCLP